MKVLITGCAGFIGFSFVSYLLEKNIKVTGIDNFDKYYSIKLKKKRCKIFINYSRKIRRFKYFRFF